MANTSHAILGSKTRVEVESRDGSRGWTAVQIEWPVRPTSMCFRISMCTRDIRRSHTFSYQITRLATRRDSKKGNQEAEIRPSLSVG